MNRRTSPPPALEGFTYVEPLGAGGFADVFLYEQQMPRRRVAVKVLLADRISSASAQEFADEANVMAMLSTHPAIVTIYQAGVAGDGRPYLVMEYCPRPNLQLRSRKEPFSVAEALRVGVQVAGAVETAHRAGVLHRDIKPANILVTEYNRPALTDFGIASTTGAVSEATGMSIPWSPPESFMDPPQSGARSDVYALGATLFTLLVGRSPFEYQGERNTGADLMERIERAPLPRLGRADAPLSLQRVLERAMAKDPNERFPSAVALGRALQKVQIELSHSVTPIDIIDDHPEPHATDDDDDGLTRVRGVVNIEPDGATRPSAMTRPVSPWGAGSTGPEFTATVAAPHPSSPEQTPNADDLTLVRAPRVLSPAGSTSPVGDGSAPTFVPGVAIDQPPAVSARRSRRPLWIALAAVAGVAVVVGGFVALNMVVAGLQPEPQATEEVVPQEVISGAVPRVADLVGTRSGDVVTFSWSNPAPEDGDAYLWSLVTLSGGAQEPALVTEATVAVPAQASEICIDVLLRREDGRASDAVRGCVP